MKFEEYRKNADKEWWIFRKSIKAKVPQQVRDRFYQLYINWNMQETNRKLVVATWCLVIVTLLLSLLTWYLQYFKTE